MTNEQARADEPRQGARIWIYQVEGEFAQDEDIPAESIVGAWPVDASGRLCGAYLVNPYYSPKTEDAAPSSDWTKA